MDNQQQRPSQADRALDHIHRELVAISASIAENGPTDPDGTNAWAYDEIRKVIQYIRAVGKVTAASTTD